MAAVSNKNENQIHIGEVILVNTTLTDNDGNPLLFSSLTAAVAKVYDILGNQLAPTVSEGETTSSLKYEVDTDTLREGIIKVEITLTYPDADFVSGEAKDIVIQELFTLYAAAQ